MNKTCIKRISSCYGKKRFPTFALASRTAHRMAQRRNEKLMAYACGICGSFHVGATLGDSPHSIRGDSRYRYIVFVRNAAGSEFIVGWANASTGGRVAEIARETPGWELTRIVDRYGRAA